MPAHYDDRTFSYVEYWQGRDYEHTCEVLAIKRLIRNQQFKNATDIGGGYGRLVPLLSEYSKHVTLIEPSAKQRSIAIKNLRYLKGRLTVQTGKANITKLADKSQDLVIMVRVMHHLPEPYVSLKELNRIIKPGGLLILEFANSHHLKARIKSFITGQPLLLTPIERRSQKNIKRKTIPFVNHSPHSIKKLLHKSGFNILKILSVSNFRSPTLKKVLPHKFMTIMENISQSLLASTNFGPSIFVLARKL